MTELRHKILGTVGAPMTARESDTQEPIEPADLQSLIELGCIKETVEINHFSFVLRSLSANERLALAKEFNENLSESELFGFNIKLLAMAIESVNGKPLENLHPSPSEDSLAVKMEIVAALQAPVIAKLLDSYTSIIDRCDKQFDMEQVKN